MTNEEIAEEILYKAYEDGTINELRAEIAHLTKDAPRYVSHSEIVYSAHQNLMQKKFTANIDNTIHINH